MSIPALTVQQPWAGLIGQGLKTLEVRTWSTSHRGPLLITSSGRLSMHPAAPGFVHGDMRCGQAIAFVNVVGCRLGLLRDKPDALVNPSGCFVFELADPQPLPPGIRVRGALGVWRCKAIALNKLWWTYVERHATPESVETPNMETTWALRMPEKLRKRCERAGKKAMKGTGFTHADWARRVLDEAARKELGLKKGVLD